MVFAMENTDKTPDTLESVSTLIKELALNFDREMAVSRAEYEGRLGDVADVINKAQTFRVNFPKYQNHRVYLAFATMIFNQRLEDECIREGIAIIKQVGDKVIIADEHLKVF